MLSGFLGPKGSLTLQGAGEKLRGVPGFAEAVKDQRIIGIGVLQRFLDLFPVEERTPKAPVKIA